MNKKSPFSVLIGLILSLHVSSWTLAKPKAPSVSQRIPGSFTTEGNQLKVFLENGVQLHWQDSGIVEVLNIQGQKLSQVNLKQAGQAKAGVSALGLEVEETDLGSRGSKKSYLKGEKKPKGRRLRASSLQSSDQGTIGEEEKKVVDRIAMTTRSFSNGSKEFEFAWPNGSEKTLLDRRQKLLSVHYQKKQGPWTFSVKQFSDGSFKRSYQGPQGEVIWTFDTIGKNYSLSFLNVSGEIVDELSCKTTCER